MLGTAGIASRSLADGEAFLEALGTLDPGCILLDVRMPRVDAFQVMAELERRGIGWPVVVMTGHGEIAVAVRAMKAGAVDFIEKPFEEELLFASLERAFALLKERGEAVAARQNACARAEQLTPREREVLQGLVGGLSNKHIARRLEISLRTVEMHRANMMARLQAGSLAEALTIAGHAGIPPLETVDASPKN